MGLLRTFTSSSPFFLSMGETLFFLREEGGAEKGLLQFKRGGEVRGGSHDFFKWYFKTFWARKALGFCRRNVILGTYVVSFLVSLIS